jgi:hypothetical protein
MTELENGAQTGKSDMRKEQTWNGHKPSDKDIKEPLPGTSLDMDPFRSGPWDLQVH